MPRHTATRQAMYSAHTKRDAPHARRDVECKLCPATRTFFAFVAPDPAERAQYRVDVMAMDWLHSHPCQISVYAHPRPVKKAA